MNDPRQFGTTGPQLSRRSVIGGAGAALVGFVGAPLVSPASGLLAGPSLQRAEVCGEPTRAVSLFAQKLGRNRYGYGLGPDTASIPGPTIEMTEGECLAIELVNNTDKSLSLHPHGVDYTAASDGTPHNLSTVSPGGKRTYVISAHAPSVRDDGSFDPGSAGYWHYHDHTLGTPHGTGGIAAGLFGALIVRREGDLRPARPPFVLVMANLTFNLKRAPHTPVLRANQGERVEFVVIGHGDSMHTFHLHGHRWVDNRTGMPTGPSDASQIIDNKTVGPADSFGFQLIAGERVGPGAWMYHCHVQSHSDLGMAGLFVVRNPDGTMDDSLRRAIRRWRRIESGHNGMAGM